MTHTKNKHPLKSSTPISDQDRISPKTSTNIKQISDENEEKYQLAEYALLVDPIPNSPIKHHKNCMADS